MPDYHFTDGDDVIQATTALGFTGSDIIYGDGGNDTAYLGDFVTFVSGPGNDVLIGSGTSQYAAWSAPKAIKVNLALGTAEDGYGGIDQLSGIGTIHLPALGGEVIGSGADETVFVFSGNVNLDMGGGSNIVHMWQLNSSDFSIRQTNDVFTIKNNDSTFTMRGATSIRFADTTITPVYTASEVMLPVKTLNSFTESEISQGWWYAGVYNEPQLIQYGASAPTLIDIGQDGDLDAIIPLSRGYRTGSDTRYPFQVFENIDGQLTYSAELSATTPLIAGARRSGSLFLERTKTDVFVTVAHDTTIETETRFDIPWRYGDITFTNTNPFVNITNELVSNTQTSAAKNSGRPTAVDAHSMAIGDINGDGMDDVLVGDYSGAFALLQTNSGTFEYLSTPLMKKLHNWIDPALSGAKPAFLLDMGLGDLNGDGLDDLFVGLGHANVNSRVFFNDKQAGFTEANSITLPISVYGTNNSLPLKNWIADLDGDGDNDLLIQYSRDEPWYGGYYLQVLINDGKGNLSDETTTRIGDPNTSPDTFGERLNWTDVWQLLDLNNDGALDIIGTATHGGSARYYLNDGTGNFTLRNLTTETGAQTILWADFNGNARVEGIQFGSTLANEGTSAINYFKLNELNSFQPPAASRAYDLSGNAGDVAKVIGAVFGPAAVKVPQYVGIGLSLMDGGLSYDGLLELALNEALTPNRTNEALVQLLYTNIVGVAADEATVNNFASLISSGQMTQLSLARLAADEPLNAINVDIVGLAQTGLDYM